MKALLALVVVSAPVLLVLAVVWKVSCESTMCGPFFIGGLYSGESVGPPLDLDGLI